WVGRRETSAHRARGGTLLSGRSWLWAPLPLRILAIHRAAQMLALRLKPHSLSLATDAGFRAGAATIDIDDVVLISDTCPTQALALTATATMLLRKWLLVVYRACEWRLGGRTASSVSCGQSWPPGLRFHCVIGCA